MKRWYVLLLLVGLVVPVVSHAQMTAYAEFSTSKLAGGPQGDYLYGATTGITLDGPALWHGVVISGDLQGRFVGKGGERLDSVAVGPKVAFKTRKWNVSPFAELLVGFGRYNDSHGNPSTDSIWQTNGGVAKQVSPHWDGVADFSYAQYGYNDGQFNPKTFSIGVVYHLAKR